MKKFISAVLVTVMLFTFVTPSFAAYEPMEYKPYGSNIPVISIFGDGEAIYNTDGEKVFHFSEMLNMLGGSEEGSLGEAAVNILTPFLIQGIKDDNWEPYYKALEKEIGDLFYEARYNEDGENWNGTDVSTTVRGYMADSLTRDSKTVNGLNSYYVYDYQFYYDWRQDPMKTADEFHEYIQAVKEVTGCDKVSVLARCLGTTVVMAYIAKYGTDDLHGLSFNGSVAAGGEIISESISGKFELDIAAINRMLSDFNALGDLNLDSFISSSLDLAAKIAMVSGIEFEESEIYAKLSQGVTSALALSTFFTWPAYWALVTENDFEDALFYVFGKEGSEKRIKYANLIEKIQVYHDTVATNVNELLLQAEADGIRMGVISKYGYQLAPVVESRNLIADQFATVKLSSFGATTSTVFDTLPEDYIINRIAEGKGKYISPDRQIDASTCLFPDYTWFTKGISHSEWSDFETVLLYKVITADTQLTVDDFECTQFVCFDNTTKKEYPMTSENCDIESWKSDPGFENPEGRYEKMFSAIKSLLIWLSKLVNFLKDKLSAPESISALV